MEDKVCLVTGANTGIGLATAHALAQKGARVLLWCRSMEKSKQALAEIEAESGNQKLEAYAGDLSSQTAIRQGVQAIKAKHERLDVLVNNAGIWNSNREITEDGIEKVWAVNHLAYFLLTRELYPLLAKAKQARIICVASDSHFQIKGLPDDPQLNKGYNGLKSYAVSKLANVMFTYEFDRRKPDASVSIYAVQPGLVQTDIGLKHTNWLHALGWKIRRRMKGNKSPKEGAATSIYLASAPDVSEKSGLYWDNKKPKSSSKGSYDDQVAATLWDKSMAWCGLENYFPNHS